jgi:hypothetical protein
MKGGVMAKCEQCGVKIGPKSWVKCKLCEVAALRKQREGYDKLIGACRMLWYDLRGEVINPSARQHLNEVWDIVSNPFGQGEEEKEDGPCKYCGGKGCKACSASHQPDPIRAAAEEIVDYFIPKREGEYPVTKVLGIIRAEVERGLGQVLNDMSVLEAMNEDYKKFYGSLAACIDRIRQGGES